MCIEEEAEKALYDAVIAVAKLPRPQLRERIFRETIHGIMNIMHWSSVTHVSEPRT